MPIDAVFDTQTVYRQCVQALANPGSVVDLAPLARHVDAPPALNAGALLFAHVVLDAETSFALISPDAAADTLTLRQRTYARVATAAEAAFVFVLGGADPTVAMLQARPGTLVDPHLGATVVLEVDAVGHDAQDLGPAVGPSRVATYSLRGPGIESEVNLAVAARFAWADTRNARVGAYPMGIDVLLIDGRHRLVAIPRTTRLDAADGRT